MLLRRIVTTGSATLLFLLMTAPTAAAQAPAEPGSIDPPTLSHGSGFYPEPFLLEITAADPGAVIRYELDGSLPGEHSSVYSGPIPVQSRTAEGPWLSTIATNPESSPLQWRWRSPTGDVRRGMVVRAYAEGPGGARSDVATATYLFTGAGEPAYDLPVISIVTDSLSLFDYNTGIYVPGKTHDENPSWGWFWGTGNYHNRGGEWERPAHLTLFENDGSVAVDQDVGIRIHGGGSRSLPQKSIRVYARNAYGDRQIRYQIFPDRPSEQYRRLILRNNGQGLISGVLRDGVMHVLVQDLDLDVQAFRPAVVFINGEYWGIHNIRERLDRHYLARHHGVDPDEVEILEYEGSPKEGSPDHYLNLIDYVERTDLSAPGAMDYVASRMQLENYAAYKAAHIYAVNMDWPGNNMEYWRPAEPDGRWRWLFFDLDQGLVYQQVNHDMLEFVTAEDSDYYANRPWATLLFRRLLTSERFRHLLINTVADQLNTVFQPEHVVAAIDSLHGLIEPYMQEHINRWRLPSGVPAWEWNVDQTRRFARDRPALLRENVVSFFELPGTGRLTVDVSAPQRGSVSVNSIDLSAGSLPWSGDYFRDVPISLVARPEAGFRLAKWEVDGPIALSDTASLSSAAGDTLRLSLRGDVSVKAVFEPLLTPHPIAGRPYVFSSWPADAAPGSYPANMIFRQTATKDPELHDPLEDAWRLSYDRDRRSRIVGLEDDGFAFINTANPQEDNGGYLGAAVLALDVTDARDVLVAWTGGTVRPNDREYAIRLQYRVGTGEPFHDVTYPDGTIVEYIRNDSEGHSHRFEPVALPSRVHGEPYVEVAWRYHYVDNGATGPRAMLRVDDIIVAERPETPSPAHPEPAGRDMPPDVTLLWEPARAAESYHLQVASEPGFGALVVDARGLVSQEYPLSNLPHGREYFWRVRAENALGSSDWSGIRSFSTVPGSVTMSGNYPNPFHDVTSIRFTVPTSDHVRLEVFDVMGRTVEILVDGRLEAGSHQKEWNATGLSSGLYFVRLTHGTSAVTHQMMLVR